MQQASAMTASCLHDVIGCFSLRFPYYIALRGSNLFYTTDTGVYVLRLSDGYSLRTPLLGITQTLRVHAVSSAPDSTRVLVDAVAPWVTKVNNNAVKSSSDPAATPSLSVEQLTVAISNTIGNNASKNMAADRSGKQPAIELQPIRGPRTEALPTNGATSVRESGLAQTEVNSLPLHTNADANAAPV